MNIKLHDTRQTIQALTQLDNELSCRNPPMRCTSLEDGLEAATSAFTFSAWLHLVPDVSTYMTSNQVRAGSIEQIRGTLLDQRSLHSKIWSLHHRSPKLSSHDPEGSNFGVSSMLDPNTSASWKGAYQCSVFRKFPLSRMLMDRITEGGPAPICRGRLSFLLPKSN